MQDANVASTTIGGIQFEMRMLDPWVANEINHMLWKIAGPSLGDMLAAFAAGGIDKAAIAKLGEDASSFLDAKLDPGLISASISGLFMRMEAHQTKAVIEALNQVTTTDGKHLPAVFSALFAGKLGTMYEYAAWGLGVQFANFFGSISTAMEWFIARAKLASEVKEKASKSQAA